MGKIIAFPQGARTKVEHLPTDVLVRLFWEWDCLECDATGTDSVKGYSVQSIQAELNRRGEGRKIAV